MCGLFWSCESICLSDSEFGNDNSVFLIFVNVVLVLFYMMVRLCLYLLSFCLFINNDKCVCDNVDFVCFFLSGEEVFVLICVEIVWSIVWVSILVCCLVLCNVCWIMILIYCWVVLFKMFSVWMCCCVSSCVFFEFIIFIWLLILFLSLMIDDKVSVNLVFLILDILFVFNIFLILILIDILGCKLVIFDLLFKVEDLNLNIIKFGLFDNVCLSVFLSVIEDFCVLVDWIDMFMVISVVDINFRYVELVFFMFKGCEEFIKEFFVYKIMIYMESIYVNI